MAEKSKMYLKDVSKEQMEKYSKNGVQLIHKLIDVYTKGLNDIVEKEQCISTFEIFCILTGFVDTGLLVFKENAKLSNDEHLNMLRQIRDYLDFELKKGVN